MTSGWQLQRSLYVPGVAMMPEDFGQRLVLLKEATGLSWEGVATIVGVDPRQLWRWRSKDVAPCGGAMLSLVDLSVQVPEGLGLLLARDLVVVRRGGR